MLQTILTHSEKKFRLFYNTFSFRPRYPISNFDSGRCHLVFRNRKAICLRTLFQQVVNSLLCVFNVYSMFWCSLTITKNGIGKYELRPLWLIHFFMHCITCYKSQFYVCNLYVTHFHAPFVYLPMSPYVQIHYWSP